MNRPDFELENDLKEELHHIIYESDVNNSYAILGILETLKQEILDIMCVCEDDTND
jgi:hypothetical protein